MRLLLLTVILATTIHANMYFRRTGWINPNPSYGHIHLAINLSQIETHLDNMRGTLEHFRTNLHNIHHPLVKVRAHTFITHSLKEAKLLQTKFQEFLLIIHLTPNERKRVKRFLGMLLAVTSLTMSLFNTAEIMHLQSSISNVVTRQQHITDILQEHEVSIHNIAHNVDSLKEEFIKAVNVIEENSAMATVHEAELQISAAMNELRHMVDCISSGTEKLLSHRLPFCFTNMSSIENAHQRLIRSSKTMNLTPIPLNIASYFQFETSFILEHKLLHIFLHVPLADFSQHLELLEFYAIPISITPTLHMSIKPENKFLAVDKDGLHTTISRETLRQCLKYSDLHFCNTPLILSKKLHHTCLGAVYSQNYTHLERKCPVIFMEVEELVEPLSGNEFMFYTHKPQTIQVNCKKGRKHIAIQEKQLLKLEQGCEVSTTNNIFRTGFDITINDEIQRWPIIWNISQTLFDIDASKLEEIVNKLKLIDGHPAPIRDIKKMIWLDSHSTTNVWLTVVISVVSLFVLSVLIYLGLRYFKLYRKKTNVENDPQA